jgi:hypothetical protein
MALSAKEKQQVMMIAGLGAILAIVLFFQLKSVKKSRGDTPPPAAAAAAQNPVPNQNAAASPLSPANSSAPQPQKIPSAKKINLKDENKAEALRQQNESAQKEWGIDPFYPGFDKNTSMQGSSMTEAGTMKNPSLPLESQKKEEPQSQTNDLKLTGISRIGGNYFATINRGIVKVGGIVKNSDGTLVKEIKQESVIVERNGGRYELRLEK